MSLIPKIGKFRHACGRVFIHTKTFFLFEKTYKNTRQKENLKFKIANIVLGPQNRQNGFWLWPRKNIILDFRVTVNIFWISAPG